MDDEISTGKWDEYKLLTKAEEYLECFEFELASKFFMKALEQTPNSVDALQMMASLLTESGSPEEAIPV